MKQKENKLERLLKKGFKYYIAIVLIGVVVFNATPIVYAASDPLSAVNNLSDFIFSLTRALGLIITGYAIVQIGLSFTSHDPSQRANGFMFVAGGLLITFAKEILGVIAG